MWQNLEVAVVYSGQSVVLLGELLGLLWVGLLVLA
jgi:hypothetical protein